MLHELQDELSARLGQPFVIRQQRAVAGGDINQALQVSDGARTLFIKLNTPDAHAMFAAEAAGLAAMAEAVRVPKVIGHGQTAQHSWLALEWLALAGRPRGRALAQALSRLHALRPPPEHTRAPFGWAIDNTIGSTCQYNRWHTDWPAFWQHQRLAPQLTLAGKKGYRLGKSERLLERVPCFFSCHHPAPALLHGDLWGGNVAALADGTPVLFDPACYYGDAEADLAMTELFGGFDLDFLPAYREFNGIDTDYRVRKQLYNLYHILNHLNLFGPDYLHQAQNMIDQLLAQS